MSVAPSSSSWTVANTSSNCRSVEASQTLIVGRARASTTTTSTRFTEFSWRGVKVEGVDARASLGSTQESVIGMVARDALGIDRTCAVSARVVTILTDSCDSVEVEVFVAVTFVGSPRCIVSALGAVVRCVSYAIITRVVCTCLTCITSSESKSFFASFADS